MEWIVWIINYVLFDGFCEKYCCLQLVVHTICISPYPRKKNSIRNLNGKRWITAGYLLPYLIYILALSGITQMTLLRTLHKHRLSEKWRMSEEIYSATKIAEALVSIRGWFPAPSPFFLLTHLRPPSNENEKSNFPLLKHLKSSDWQQ